jgi:hypothetical protein
MLELRNKISKVRQLSEKSKKKENPGGRVPERRLFYRVLLLFLRKTCGVPE